MYEHLIGQPAILDVEVSPPGKDGPKIFHIAVTIEDTRRVYGRTEFLVRPAQGGGAAQWVSRERVRPAGGRS